MAFNCNTTGKAIIDQNVLIERTHSAFGDNYSIKSRGSFPTNGGTGATIDDDNYAVIEGVIDDDQNADEADYDDGATDLYRRIENKDWDGALARIEKHPYEARTWVSRRELHSNKTRWKLLPLHAVCIFRAPLALIEALLEVYPRGARCKDDQGMLPVHLACRNGASKGVVLTLLNAFEPSIGVRDRKGRSPIDLVQASSSANKESVLAVLKKYERQYDNEIKNKNQEIINNRSRSSNNGGNNSKGRHSTSKSPPKEKPKGSGKYSGGAGKGSNNNSPKSNSNSNAAGAGSNNNNTNTNNSNSNTTAQHNNQSSTTLNNSTIPTNETLTATTTNKVVPLLGQQQSSPTGAAVVQGNGTMTSSIIPQVPINNANSNSTIIQSLIAQAQQQQLLNGGGGGSISLGGDTIQTHEVDYEHRTVLFRLLLKKEWKPAAARANHHPEEASTFIVTKGFNGNLRFLPLHKACVLQPPEFVVQALIESFSEGTKLTDQDGWLPLHCGCFYGANERVVGCLVKSYAKGAQCKDDEGRLPLHYACLKGAAQGVVDCLLETFPKGAMSKDEEGRLPIHHACGKGAPEGVVDALLKASPKGAQSKDDQGRLALHHACRKNASERVVRTLLRVYPRASQIKDDQDKLPIHYACQNGASAHVVSLLLTTYPESVYVQNGFGYTPIGEAKNAAESNPKMDGVLKLLEKTKREQDKLKADSGETAEVQSKITVLEDKVARLDKILGKVVNIGKEMRYDLVKKHKDPTAVLEKLADRLIELGGKKEGSDKTPLKSRNSTTPIKNLFSRNQNKSGEKVNNKK